MQHLTLVALSEDGSRLLLATEDGAQYTLDVDNALRSAVRGEQPRPGHLETRMDSALRPRDIQARIRAGETAEAVAAAAGSTVEKIMPYAAPVLAERAHVADRAQRSSIRRRPSETSAGGARTLADAVDAQLRSVLTDPETVEWDAYRREDGRWSLTGLYETSERTGVATFTFDLPGNFVTIENEDARWIVGDVVAAPVVDEAGRRLSAVPSALGDDAIELVNAAADEAPAAPAPVDVAPLAPEPITPQPAPVAVSPVAEENTLDLTETVNRIRGTVVPPVAAPQAPVEPVAAPVEAVEVVTPAAPQAPVEPVAPAAPAAEQSAEAVEPAAEETPAKPAKKPAKRRGRASVPSWDEIMFGGSDD